MDDSIERVRALDKAATPGQWDSEPIDSDDEWAVYSLDYDDIGDLLPVIGYPGLAASREDVEFIAAARTMLPAAVEALARVRALHAPKNVYPMKDGTWIRHCRGCQTVATFTEWPCETYQATEVEA